MKVFLRPFLLVFFVLLSLNTWAVRLYWVGGTGNFNDANHWSFESGGQGGAKSPTVSDDVYFDGRSFSYTSVINFIGKTEVHDLIFTDNTHPVILAGTQNEKIIISGEIKLNSYIDNQFLGAIQLVSSKANTPAHFGVSTLKGNLYFDGTGSWNLQTLLASDNSEVYLNNGRVILNNSSIKSGSLFIGDKATLEASGAVLNVKNKLWFNDPATLIDNGLYIEAPINDASRYYTGSNQIPQNKILNNNSPLACAFTFTIVSQPKCATSCDGVVIFTIPAACAGTAGQPYTASWTSGGLCPAPAGTPAVGLSVGTYTQSNICGCGSAYTVIFRDNLNAFAGSANVNISAPSVIQIFFDPIQPLCNAACNGKIIANIIGGTQPYSLKWTPGPTHINNLGTDSITGLCVPPSSYTVITTDANNCGDTSTTSITAPTIVVANGNSSPPTCFGSCSGMAWVAPSGGTPFGAVQSNGIFYKTVWDGNPVLKNDTLFGLCAGSTHTCVATDKNGCTDTYIVTIGVSPPLITFTKNPVSGTLNINCLNTCNGVVGVTGVTGGTGPGTYIYTWAPVGGVTSSTANSATYSNLCGSVAGTTYTCTIKDGNGCSVTATFTVKTPPALSHVITHTNPKCSVGPTGSATVTESGGAPAYTYTWTAGTQGGVSPVSTSSNLGGGTYTVFITDANNCLDTATVTLTPPTAVTGTITTTINPTCPNLNNGKLCVTAGGGTPGYGYSWAPIGGAANCTPSTLTVTPGGTSVYSVTITDFNNCTAVVTGTMTSPPQATITPSVTNPLCSGICNGSATLTPVGVIPFTYAWSCSGTTLDHVGGQCDGTSCSYTVTDGNTCKYTGSVPFVSPPAISFTKNPASGILNISCKNTCDGSIGVTGVAGGTGPYVFTWAPLGGVVSSTANSSTYSGLCGSVAGITYTCTITDFNNCSVPATFTVKTPPALSHVITHTNPKCNVGPTGSATVTEGGGVGPYTFTWSPVGTQSGASPISINSNIGGGTYTVFITDANNCLDTATVTLTPPTAVTGTITTTINPTCPNLNNGKLCVTAGGGTPGYGYSWAPIGGAANCTPSTLTVTPGGTSIYSVTITDFNNCTAVVTGTLTSPPQATVTASVTNPPCGGICNGTATLTPVGGVGPFSYAWSCTGSTLPTIGGQCGGTTCNYTVTDGNTCKYPGSVSFTVAPTLSVSISATALTCAGGCNSIITSTVGGGTPTYTYTWSGPGVCVACPIQTNMCVGSYTCQVTDANGCVQSPTVALTSPPPMTITLVPTQPTCNASCNGSILATISGGTSPYPGVNWSPSVFPNPPGTLNPTNLCGGLAPGTTYTLTITDNNGCVDSNSVTLIKPSLLTIASVNTGSVTCTGLCNGTATATPSGGTPPYTYSWDGGAFTNSDSTSGLCAGPHIVGVKDANGCSGTFNFNIIGPNPISVSIINVVNTCGVCSGSATANPFGGTSPYTYTWSPTGGNLVTADSLCIGNYTVTVGDANNCPVATAPCLIGPTVNVAISASSQSVSCNNACDGIANGTASNGTAPYTMVWTSSPTYAIVTSCVAVTSCSVANLCPGVYIITATDANGCGNKDSVTVGNPPILTVGGSTTNATCFGKCTGSATVTPFGGTSPYNVTWSDGPIGTPRSNMCSGVYTANVLDSKGCPAAKTFTITSNPQFTVTPTTTSPLACGGTTGSITVTPSGGTPTYTVSWANPPGGTGTTQGGLIAGIYTYTVTDALGCDTILQTGLSDPGTATITATTQSVSCYATCDGSATVTAVGVPAITITWPGNAPGVSPLVVNNLCDSVYIVQTLDGNGCKMFTNVTINGPTIIKDSATIIQPNCGSGGTITLHPSGGSGAGYTFNWDGVPFSPNPITNLSAGTHTCIITDSKPCSQTYTYTINPASSLTVAVNPISTLCSYSGNGSASANVSGGTPAYSYTWTSSCCGVIASGVNIPNVSNLQAGSYTLDVKDIGGCSSQQTFTITAAPAIVPNFGKNNNLCNVGCTGSATVAPTGGTGLGTYSFVWQPGVFTTPIVSGLCPNPYNVIITDGNNCKDTVNFNIIMPPSLTVTVNSTPPTCSGTCNGTATVTVIGGTAPYTVGWSPNVCLNCPIANNLCGGPYTIVATDSNGCTAPYLLNLNAPPALSANTTVTPPNCVGDCNGSIVSNTLGGTRPYTYSWTQVGPGGTVLNTDTTSNYSNLCAKNYTLIITDFKNCKDTSTQVVNNPAPLAISASSIDASCGANDGSITISSVSGTGTVTVLWLNPPGCANSFTCTSLGFGVYSVQLTDSKGCKDTFNIPISNPNGPFITSVLVNDTCNNACDGSISVTASGTVNVVTPYTFTWTPSGFGTITTTTNSSTYSNLCSPNGPFICTVKDSLGCGTATSFTIGQPPAIQDNGNFTNATCVGINDGTITSIASGGTGTTYTYTLDGGVTNTTGIFTNVSVGSHAVCISDSVGCQKCILYNIGSNTIILPTISSTNINCSSNCNGTATLSIGGGGTSPYSITWNDPNSQTGPIAFGLCGGTYTATITDASGCKAIDTAKIIAQTPIVPNTVTGSPACGLCNGIIAVVPTGGTPGTTGYTYVWNTNATTSAINNVCAGLYQVDVTDSLGCKQSFQIPVSNPGAPSVTVTPTAPACSNACSGSIATNVNGGTVPYTYLWLPNGQTTPSINGQCPGVYFVEVKDSVGCIFTDSAKIAAVNTFTVTTVKVSPTCSVCNGSITAVVNGGTGSFTYNWSNGAPNAPGNSPICAGNYSLVVTDNGSGCIDTLLIGLNSNANGPILQIALSNALCNGLCSGSATVTAFNGTPTYTWSPGGQTSSSIVLNNLCSNVANAVLVTDALGCISTAQVLISQPNKLISSLPVITQPRCNNDCNGSINTIISGGTPSYTYTWNPATVIGSGGNLLCSANYSVSVTDANGCIITEFDTLFNPALLTITGTVTPTSCNSTADGAINTTTNGGTPAAASPGYTWQWSGGSSATTSSLSNIIVGNYTVHVTDSRNCKDSANFVVTPNVNITVNAGRDTTLCSVPNFVLHGDTTGATSMQWIQLPNPPLNVIGTTPTLSVTPPAGATTQYVLTAQKGVCTNSDTINVTTNTVPLPDAGLGITLFSGQTGTIGGSPTNPGIGTISWHPNLNISDTTAANPTVTTPVTTTYTVYVTNASGCVGWDTVTVTVLPTFVIPNGFSPNGDGYNDSWQIDYMYMFPNCEVEVYNRWGEQLFYSKGYNTPWNGSYQGKQVPVGTYYYVIRLNDKKFPDHFAGPLTILR